MSHVASVEIEVKDLECLSRAARDLGLELVKDQDTYKWFGVSVGDYPLPKGFAKEDLGKCEHAIRIPDNSGSYEIGVVKRRDGKPGYVLHWDFWNRGYGLQDKVGDDCSLLVQAYAKQVAIKELRMQGYNAHESVDAEGSIQLVFTR